MSLEKSVILTFDQVQELAAKCQENDDPGLALHYLLLRIGGTDESQRALSHHEALEVLLEPVNVTDIFRLLNAGGTVSELVAAATALDGYRLTDEVREKLLTSYISRRAADSEKHDPALKEMLGKLK